MMPNGELGYVFKSAVTANGCLMPRVDYSVFTGVFAGILSYFPRARRYSGHRECNAVDAPYG